MSRTVEAPQSISPVQAHIFWNGKLGRFGVLNTDDGGGFADVPNPFRFVCLDADTFKVGGVKGYGEKDEIKWKSTMGHPKYGRSMRVWLDNAPEVIEAEGTWGAISFKIEPQGAKYVAMLFVLTDFGQGSVMACIHLHGRAYAAWINATQKQKINPCGDISFSVSGSEEMQGKKGDASLVPVFTAGTLSEERRTDAEQADFDLQLWLCDQFESPAKELGIGAAGATRSNVANIEKGNTPVFDTGFPEEMPEQIEGLDTLPF